MKTIQKPYWILLAITLPQAILLLIFGKIYSVIATLLKPDSIGTWRIAGVALAVLWLGFTAYALFAAWRKKPLHPLSGAAVLAGYLPWAYYVITHLEEIIPWDIPRWMLFWTAPETFLLTLIVPGLLYGLILLAVAYMPTPEKYKPLRDFLLLILIPGGFFLLCHVIFSFMHFGLDFSSVFSHLFPIIVILGTACFFFLLYRLAYGLFRDHQSLIQKVITPLIIILPVAGLLLNQSAGNICGDFSHPAFLILAIITGGLLILPAPPNPGWRLALFLGRGLVFPFTFYFFLVFLPYLPLAIILILAIGTGFLILSPTLLGLKHVLALREDFMALQPTFRPALLTVLLLLSWAILPGSIYLMIRNDSNDLQQALACLYRTAYLPNFRARIIPSAVDRVLKTLSSNQNSDSSSIGLGVGERIPYLTSVYNWLVLDNLTLSDQKVRDLERVFLNRTTPPETTSDQRSGQAQPAKPEVIIQNAKTSSTYDFKQQCWRSRIDLELKNTSRDDQLRQFAVDFELPTGCYISGYDLVINGKVKKGLLADQRAATWVYQQVVTVRRDPGILVYSSGNTVALRVYPFNAAETRHTGLELIHAIPVTLTLEDRQLQLGNAATGSPQERRTPGAVFLSARAKQILPRITRRPMYHFIVDFSRDTKDKTPLYLKRVAEFIKTNRLRADEVTISAANYALKTTGLKSNWQSTLSRLPVEGGFHFDRAVKTFLYQNYLTASSRYPVIIAVTDSPDHGQIYEDYGLWRLTIPDSPLYYRLAADHKLYANSLLADLIANPKPVAFPLPEAPPVLAWPNQASPKAYLRDNQQDSIVLTPEAFQPLPADLSSRNWETGLALEARGLGLALNPANYRQRELALVKASLTSKIMNRLTSYLALENAAQEAVLREKQNQILATKKIVDVGNTDELPLDAPEMAEPPFWLLALLGAAIYLVRKWQSKRTYGLQ